jgi:hypothetical protein
VFRIFGHLPFRPYVPLLGTGCPNFWYGVLFFWARTKRHAVVRKLMQPLAGGVLADTKILAAIARG